MDTQQQRGLKDLFQDKKFLWSLPIFIIIVGGMMWWTLRDETPEPLIANNMNPTVPLGKPDSARRNRLDLQNRAIENNPSTLTMVSGTVGEGQTGGMQAHIPGQGDYDRYVYNRRFNPAANSAPNSGSGFSSVESMPPLPPNSQVRNAMPTNLKVGGPRIPLSEQDVMMPDEETSNRPSSTLGLNERKKAEYQAALQKQQKLTVLLDEYKQDKEAKKLAEEDKKKVTKSVSEPIVSSLDEKLKGIDSRNSFYGLYSEDARRVQQAQLEAEVGTIRGMIFGDQDVVSSGRVQIRLLEPLVVRGISIPAGTIIYGTGGFSAERVTVRITALQYENHIFPVNLTVYDMDGMSGVYVPNIIGLQEARQAVGQVPGSINLNTGSGGTANVGAMAGASAAQAGVQGVRQIVQKKTTLQKAHLKNNYFVLLRSAETNPGQAQN